MSNKLSSTSIPEEKYYIIILFLSGACGVLSLVIGDIFDKLFGFLTLLASISYGFTIALPWTILSIVAAEAATFFLLGIFEFTRFAHLIIFHFESTSLNFLGYYVLKMGLHMISFASGVFFLQKINDLLSK